MIRRPMLLDATGQTIKECLVAIKDTLLGSSPDPVVIVSADDSGSEPVIQDDTGVEIAEALLDVSAAIEVPWPIAKGGSGQTGISGATSGIVTASTGTINTQSFKRWGKVATLYLSITSPSSQTAVGGNCFTGTIASNYRPAAQVNTCGFYGSSAVIVNVQANGTVTARVIGAALDANTTLSFGVTYLLP